MLIFGSYKIHIWFFKKNILMTPTQKDSFFFTCLHTGHSHLEDQSIRINAKNQLNLLAIVVFDVETFCHSFFHYSKFINGRYNLVHRIERIILIFTENQSLHLINRSLWGFELFDWTWHRLTYKNNNTNLFY